MALASHYRGSLLVSACIDASQKPKTQVLELGVKPNGDYVSIDVMDSDNDNR
jgi:hypothetical protein